MRLVNDEGIRHDDKTEPTLTNSTTLGKLINNNSNITLLRLPCLKYKYPTQLAIPRGKKNIRFSFFSLAREKLRANFIGVNCVVITIAMQFDKTAA